MKYSVIIPVYNVEALVGRCIESVVHQIKSDTEIIIIDDGSTDDSGKICDVYANEYDCIKAIHQSNKGLSGARNTGLKNATGEWILFLDSDDYWKEDFFEIIDRTIKRHASDYYKFNYMKVYDSENFDRIPLILENEMVDISTEELRLSYLTDRLLNYHIGWEAHTGVYKKQLLDRYHIQFKDTKEVYAEDLLFTMEYILHSESIYLLCDCLYMYYTREGSLSLNVNNETVLPRLYNLLDVFLDDVKNNRVLKKNFYKIYFCIINFHVRYNLHEMDIESIRNQIKKLSSNSKYKLFRKLIRRDSLLCKNIVYGREWI